MVIRSGEMLLGDHQDVATVGCHGVVLAKAASFPWVKPGWEMTECSDAENLFK